MARIDDPIGKIKEHATEPPTNPGFAIAISTVSWIPHIGGKIKQALDLIRGHDKDSRLDFLTTAIVEQLEAQGRSVDDIVARLDTPQFLRTLTVGIERIFFGASERKARRFAAVITDTVIKDTTEQGFEDAASFIRALDELSEDDIKVLKHLYNHQSHRVNEQHAMPYNEFFQGNEMRNMLMDARNLGMQMDEFYSRTNRLIGYGLALPLDKAHGSMGDPNDFALRMTLLGKRLVDMLVRSGESTDVTKRKPDQNHNR
jgi:hypothetical protein